METTNETTQERTTPRGPWAVNPTNPTEVVDADGFIIAETFTYAINTNGDVTPRELTRAEAKRTARLLAATPELLAALEDLLQLAELCLDDDAWDGKSDMTPTQESIAAARAVVAKVNGA